MGIIGHDGAPAATTPAPGPAAPAAPAAPTLAAPAAPTAPAAPAHNEPSKARRFFDSVVAFLTIPIIMLSMFLFWYTRNSRWQLYLLIGLVTGIALGFLLWVYRWFHRERRPIDHPVPPAPPADPSVYHHFIDAYGNEWQWCAGATAWQRWNGHAWV